MPKKSVREMSKSEKKFHPLSGRVIRLIVLGAALMGVIMMFIGLGLYV